MLKVKKMFSAFLGAVMTANVFMTTPFSAFSDEETAHIYTHDGYEISYDVTNSWGNTEVVASANASDYEYELELSSSSSGFYDDENTLTYFYVYT